MNPDQLPHDFPSRILLIVHSLEGGGSERQMSTLANYLICLPKVSRVGLMTLAPQSLDRYSLDSQIERIALDVLSENSRGGFLRGLKANLYRGRRLRMAAEKFRPDVVISFCDSTNILTLFAVGNRYPVLISERSDPRHQKLSRSWEWLRRWTYPRASVCVTQTDDVSRFLNQRIFGAKAKTKIFTIPSAVITPNLDFEKIESQRARSPKRLLYVGRLAPEKRVDKILDSWAQIHEQAPLWRLRIVGSGPLESTLKAQSRSLQVEHRVDWIPWTQSIWEEYFAASAFVLASRYEGFPQVLVEAISTGLPSVIFDCSPSIRECVKHNESALVVSELSQMSQAMRELLLDETLRRRLGENAKMGAERFQWPVVAPKWLQAINCTQ